MSNMDYSGSIGIDSGVLDEVGLFLNEKVLVVNLSTGARFETYVIPEEKGSDKYCIYGGAARLAMKGDKIIIMSFGSIPVSEAKAHKPKIKNYELPR